MNTITLDYVELKDTDLAQVNGGISAWDLVTFSQLLVQGAEALGALAGWASVQIEQAAGTTDSVRYYESLPAGAQ
jgi:hypothetical protein